ncbi:hypothetical protein CHCC20488_0989 [Bacillus paralicheniformis]|uniref:Uncharacterized protein n=1 Tax=Bacillus paralicheniformis TaxID=1648923 RepID=A0ABY3FVP6_9BACI|nr:hypothetical protein CHCC5022_2358 [Bacillus paralicheniformis]TWJ77782.1 hypothetical protein CHCC4186_0224 [Bacillus paralicheniformis]TWJ81475.1 hypothetical protein CHCC20497_4562 [Bacillus paralicheniformis]TWK51857.1 hypothetical protein CHCC20347_3157 [Bacillus paralicheniformis]TWL37148.1 hypothetical protein CHCC15381_1384 [Bacillus paralicheniformis]
MPLKIAYLKLAFSLFVISFSVYFPAQADDLCFFFIKNLQ